ncbi:hypothetical protein L1887_53146 [Cichorium endivia]|nr:hypothetical protein L1887_53146 [Cichorium endivia]
MGDTSATALKGSYSEASVNGAALAGISATAIGASLSGAKVTGAATAALNSGGAGAGAASTLTINGKDVAIASGDKGAAIATAINTANTGATAVWDDTANKMTLSSSSAISVSGGTAVGLTDGTTATAPASGTTTLTTAGAISVNGKAVTWAANAAISTVLTSIKTAVGGTGDATIGADGRIQVKSAGGADVALSNTTAGSLSALGLSAGTSQAKLSADTSISLNGVEVKFKAGDTTDAIVSSINSASTGATASKNSDGSLALFSKKDIVVADGSAGTGLTALGLTAGSSKATTLETTVSNLSILTAASSQQAIQALDGAMQQIDSQRSQLGAVQNRFDSTTANLQSISQNSSAAKGRVEDADFSAEAAELTKQQTLQQASTAILAQANQLPSAVLKLLQ